MAYRQSSLLWQILTWLIHAAVVMISVKIVSPLNRNNTLLRALLVTFLVAIPVALFSNFWGVVFVIPALIGLVLWILVYLLVYGIGPLRSILAGLLQLLIAGALHLVIGHGRLW